MSKVPCMDHIIEWSGTPYLQAGQSCWYAGACLICGKTFMREVRDPAQLLDDAQDAVTNDDG